MNLSQRIYFKKSEITHPDTLNKSFKLVDINFTRIGNKEFQHVKLIVKSAKTGNESRQIITDTVEIEGLSGIYNMAWSEKMIKKREKVVDGLIGIEYKVTPIARVAYYGYVIYKLEPIN